MIPVQILDPAGGWGLAAFDSNTFELKEVSTLWSRGPGDPRVKLS